MSATRRRGASTLLGYEVGSGADVRVPHHHTIITGQTQNAGKTTAVEGLIHRSEMRALTFVTKRGEGSFAAARRIPPYFRERADWQFVSSILEASRGEKLKYERAWIIRASKGARTLGDVHRNVREALKKARGQNENAYLCLDAYLENVVPYIGDIKWAASVQLERGVNVMDLSGLTAEMQHLVIRSSMDWVLEHAEDTVIVVPEAWKFMPQGRGTPVKLGAEAFIRQGAALGLYLWADSQDIAGVDKLILKSIPNWILGVQRESNEIKRTLDQIPAGIKKPRPEALATLSLGQFYACHGTVVAKTYARPAWMGEEDARAIARGEKSVDDVHPPKSRPAKESVVDMTPEPTRDQVDDYRESVLLGAQMAAVSAIAKENQEPPTPTDGDDDMSAEAEKKLDRLTDLMEKLLSREVERHPPSGGSGATPAPQTTSPPNAKSGGDGGSRRASAEPIVGGEEALYQRFKTRLIAELPRAGGGGPIVVTPPEKLRLDFQREEAARIVAEAGELSTLSKRVMLLLLGIGTDSFISQKTIAERLGRSTGGQSWMDLGKAVKGLAALGFVEVVERQGAKASLRRKIAEDLQHYSATERDVDETYQNVLAQLASD